MCRVEAVATRKRQERPCAPRPAGYTLLSLHSVFARTTFEDHLWHHDSARSRTIAAACNLEGGLGVVWLRASVPSVPRAARAIAHCGAAEPPAAADSVPWLFLRNFPIPVTSVGVAFGQRAGHCRSSVVRSVGLRRYIWERQMTGINKQSHHVRHAVQISGFLDGATGAEAQAHSRVCVLIGRKRYDVIG